MPHHQSGMKVFTCQTKINKRSQMKVCYIEFLKCIFLHRGFIPRGKDFVRKRFTLETSGAIKLLAGRSQMYAHRYQIESNKLKQIFFFIRKKTESNLLALERTKQSNQKIYSLENTESRNPIVQNSDYFRFP